MKQFDDPFYGQAENALDNWVEIDPSVCEGMTSASGGPFTTEEKLLGNLQYLKGYYDES